MDSMRSLNKSLPSSKSNTSGVSADQIAAFRSAALAVSTLFKAGINENESSRQAGYQDCLGDLLKFLDSENLALQDGEGWRVRQWATAKYDIPNTEEEGSEVDHSEEEQAQRATTAEPQTQSQPQQTPDNTTPSSPIQETPRPPPAAIFQFSAGTDSAMQTDETQSAPTTRQASPQASRSTPKPPRNHNRHNNKHGQRSTTRAVAGSKRKMPFPDMAEIFDFGFSTRKDGFGGSGGGGGGG
ncbi:hypothetical protein LTR66_016733, partial [Elasticomyces elasticus]